MTKFEYQTWNFCYDFIILNNFTQLSRSCHLEQPIFRIPNILFVYFFIDFFVKHIFFEARLERVIAGAADCWSYFWSSKKWDKQNFCCKYWGFGNLVDRWREQDNRLEIQYSAPIFDTLNNDMIHSFMWDVFEFYCLNG